MADNASQQFAKLPSSSKILLLAVLLAMIGAAYYSVLHGPLNEEIDAVVAQKAQLEDQLTKSKDLQARFLKLREELEQRKVAEQELVRVLPPRAEIASMLAELNRLAELSGLAIQTVEPLSEEASQYYYRIPVNVAVSGKYHQLAKFFYNVSRLQRAINMENIVITEPKLQGDDLVLQVRVLATTFRRKDA
ncbi:MAG: Type pilus biosis protein PilO [Myxococcaceae bacterium]|nr:Type pilus biosis protein PilO [Myxococcaceae bacterium]